MYCIFKSLHPPNDLLKGSGVMQKCFVALKSAFPLYHDEILKRTSEVLTFQRLRLMNKQNMKKSKDNEGTHAMTTRGAQVNARNAMLYKPPK